MYFDYYTFDLLDNGTSVMNVDQKTFGNQTTYLNVYNLQYNHQ